MTNEVLVSVDNVSKKFCRDLKRSLWYGVKDISAEVLGRKVEHKELRKEEFWAVKDVSFELRRGECLGLIGHNGAGKSTLLKMLNGLIKPDKGTITMKGRIGALIELGAGFNPILTGRENIYVNGQILGFTKREIDEKFDEIVEFSEIGEFIDTPVQNYSSGMKVRLGFAIASQMEPDVLIVDEVLAVGDVGFKIKCLNKISEVLGNSAVILVSHNMPQIAKTATSLLLLAQGNKLFHSSNILEGIEKYFEQFQGEKFSKFGDSIYVKNFKINQTEGLSQTIPVKYNEDLEIDIEFRKEDRDEFEMKLVVVFVDKNLKPLASCMSETMLIEENDTTLKSVRLCIPNLQLAIGKFTINLNFHKKANDQQLFLVSKYNAISEVSVSGAELVSPTSIHFVGKWSY